MNYKQIYFDLIKKALQRKSIKGYYETHHIIPRCLGGTDDKSNLVKLTAREHFVAHYLLVKIKPGNFKLINAALMMSCTNKLRTTSRTYEWMRKKYVAGKSDLMRLPEHNASFGTCWVYHTEQKESKRINKEELQTFLEQGWKKGRVLNFDRCRVCEQCEKHYVAKLTLDRVSGMKYCSSKCYHQSRKHNEGTIYKTIHERRDDIIKWKRKHMSLNDICKALGFSKAAGYYYVALKQFLAKESLV